MSVSEVDQGEDGDDDDDDITSDEQGRMVGIVVYGCRLSIRMWCVHMWLKRRDLCGAYIF